MAKDTEPIETETTTYDSGCHDGPPDLRFVHYNDVYHVERGSREPVGGLARFKTLCQHYQHGERFKGQPEAITFFSGDAFNPSLESSITKGKHMVPAMNALETTVSCLGNHDLDFGVEQFQYLAKKCHFPWLCANVLDPALGDDVPIGHCKRTVMLTSSNGIKIGVIGLVEREWLDTINTLPPNLKYLSASATARELAPQLRAEGAEMIVVVSHQREPNDNKLAEKVNPGDVDIILGGHDHFYNHSLIHNSHVLRSGSDFKQLSYIEARRKKNGSKGWNFNITRRDVVASIPEDQSAAIMVSEITDSLKSKLEKPIGYTVAPLDGRFTTVRLKESNLGNFVCDLMKLHYHADCTIMASGTIRGDQIYPPGLLKVKDMMNCFPFEDPCVVVSVQGKHLLAALENGVGKYPALEGRFPQVSGIEFTFDANKEAGKRCSEVRVGDESLDLAKHYKVATRDYMVRGKDGFTSLMIGEEGGEAKSIVNEENGLLISMIIRQYFMSLKVLGKWKYMGKGLEQHWNDVQSELHGAHPIREAGKPAPAEAKKVPTNGTAANGHKRTYSKVDKGHEKDIGQGDGAAHYSSTDYVDDSDSEADISVPDPQSRSDRELLVMRRAMAKWWRLAGLPGRPHLCEEKGNELRVPWTKGVAPRLEGRIKILNEVQ